MSRHDDSSADPMNATFDESLEDAGRLLREPVRPMPDSLRSRLLAIPADVHADADAEEVDRLYGVALDTAGHDDATHRTGHEASAESLSAASLGTTTLRAAVVRLLAAVFRDARTVRPVPERLASNLRGVRRSARPAWKTRWITEPRWAAAACWLLAFVLTLGTGDAVAGLLDAPAKLNVTSSTRAINWTATRTADWTQRATEGVANVWTEGWTEASDGIAAGVGFVGARGVAIGTWAEARAERTLREVEASWIYLTDTIAPQINASPTPDSRPRSSQTTETNPGDTSPEEARDDR